MGDGSSTLALYEWDAVAAAAAFPAVGPSSNVDDGSTYANAKGVAADDFARRASAPNWRRPSSSPVFFDPGGE
jgi:hypothetical protein